MRLTDNLKDWTADLEDYIKANDQETAVLIEVNLKLRKEHDALLQDYADRSADLGSALLEKAAAEKMVELAAEEMTISREVIADLKDSNIDKVQEIYILNAKNVSQKNRLTELSVKVDDAMKFVDQVRIVLFDVVRMYGELEKANDSEGKD